MCQFEATLLCSDCLHARITYSLGAFAGFPGRQNDTNEHFEGRGVEGWVGGSELNLKSDAETDHTLPFSDTGETFFGYWACKGCDWKRNDEVAQDRSWKRKIILNDGYPLCQLPKFGCEDPRWEQKDDLHYPSQNRRLDLPQWAFTSPDELNDSSRLSQIKSVPPRGIKGLMQPVIRINACVVKDHGSFVSESRPKVKGKERLSSRSSRTYSTSGDTKRSSEDGHCKSAHEQDSQDSCKKSLFSITKDRLYRLDELKLQLGDWYFLDGAGHERGPLSFPELQGMANQDVIQKHSSVFRKQDKIWVPVSSENCSTPLSESSGAILSGNQSTFNSFHNLHPQFIGYTRGRLHELVMKSYKSREFAAAINEVLDPWINARQPKKEIEKHIYYSGIIRFSKFSYIFYLYYYL